MACSIDPVVCAAISHTTPHTTLLMLSSKLPLSYDEYELRGGQSENHRNQPQIYYQMRIRRRGFLPELSWKILSIVI